MVARNAAWRRRQRLRTPESETDFRAARNFFHRLVRSCKQAFWRSWLAEQSSLAQRDPREAANRVRRQFTRAARLPCTMRDPSNRASTMSGDDAIWA